MGLEEPSKIVSNISKKNILLLLSTSVLVVISILGGAFLLEYYASNISASSSTSSSVPTMVLDHTNNASLPPTLSLSATQAPEVVIATMTPMPTDTPMPTFTPTPLPSFSELITYGVSFEGRPLIVYRLGYGNSARLIVGAIHGGYEWNTVHVISDTLAYFEENPEELPSDVTLYLIPCANPDGYVAGTDPIVARMNGNGVDLNRNWDYEWQQMATHGTRPVKAGSEPFSEPETRALRDLILEKDVEAAIFYHSVMGVVFSGEDRDKSATFELTEMLSSVTGYPHQKEGMPGQVTTGNSIDWLSKVGIPATEIELSVRGIISEDEWQRNLRGILAFVNWQEEARLGSDEIE